MIAKERPARGFARQAILGATMEIIANQGIDAVTHRRVAELARVSPGSTTHHFASREDLLREAFRFYLEQADWFMAALGEEIAATVNDPLERVRRFAAEIVRREFVEPGEQYIRAEHEMLLFASTDGELAAHVRVWDARVVGQLAGDLEAAGWPRAVETARTLINLIRGYELERLLNPRLDVDEFERRVDALLTANRDARDGRATP
jgi:AcrR family transcriptional regulator